MGIFDLFKSKNDPYRFKCFLNKQFITEEQYHQLVTFKEQNRSYSKILHDYTPACLHSFVVIARKNLYNNIYVSDTYSDYTARQPYWIAENIDGKTRKKIHDDHKALLYCLLTSSLISSLTYDKLSGKAEEGIIYRAWEIVTLAATLTANEEQLKKINLGSALKPLLNSQVISPADFAAIQTDLQQGGINEFSEVVSRYGKKMSLVANVTVADINKYMASLIDKCLESLPFCKTCRVVSIDFSDDLINPYHKNNKQKHTVIKIEFNKKEYVFPFNTSRSYFKIANRFDITMIPSMVNHLCHEYGDRYNMLAIKDHFMDQSGIENGNIKAYHLLLLKKGNVDSVFLKDKISLSLSSFISIEEKENYLARLFSILDKDRIGEADKLFIHKNIAGTDLPGLDVIPNYIPALVIIIWDDTLSDTYTYATILEDLAHISTNRFIPEKITDSYNTVEEGDRFEVTLTINSKHYSITLKKGTVDYDIMQLISLVQAENDLGGHFYAFEDPYIQDGYSVIFLSRAEKERVDNDPLFTVHDLSYIKNYQ